MADKKFSDFTDGGEMQVGDIPVGLRTSDLTLNYKFDFPGTGIKDSNGNYLFQYETAGASAINYLIIRNSVTLQNVVLTADGDDTNIDIELLPKGSGALILDGLTWPTADGAANTFLKTDGAGNLSFTSSSVTTSITGTANQVLVNGTSGTQQVGDVTLTTPQNINTTSSPTFAGLTLSSPLSVASGGTGLSTFVADRILYASGTTTIGQLPALTNGQLVVGSTGTTPVIANITAGANISVTNGAGSITIAATGLAGFSWTTVTGTSQAMLSNNGYIANNAGLVTLTLPATSAVGDEIDIIGKGAGGWLIQCGVGQQIVLGSSTTSVAGSLASTNAKDSLYMICTVANTEWQVASAPQGNITVA